MNLCVLFCCFLQLLIANVARAFTLDYREDPRPALFMRVKLNQAEGSTVTSPEACGAEASLIKVAELICENCHEMISHVDTNTRAKCRKNCFRNDEFRKCLKYFTNTATTQSPRNTRYTVYDEAGLEQAR